MFGINKKKSTQAFDDEQILFSLLDRSMECDALGALTSAIKQDKHPISLSKTAIAIDANVFLRLSSHKKSADIIDYLNSGHFAPVILPGQTIQEFWNNQYQAVETLSKSIKKQFDGLNDTVKKLDPGFGDYNKKFKKLVEEFNEEYGFMYDENTNRNTLSLLEMLSQKASVSYVSRDKYKSIANLRKRTKTPPGFKDDGDGDFYVWVDLLAGLYRAKKQRKEFLRVAFVTLDQKMDWSSNGRAHPILSAEIKSLLDVPFEIWNIEQLLKEIDNA